MHGAARWLLRQWAETERFRSVDQIPLGYSPNRGQFNLAVQPKNVSDEAFHYTFVVFRRDEFKTDSVANELRRDKICHARSRNNVCGN